MRYTLIPKEYWIDELIVDVKNEKELQAEIETFCKATGADPFTLDCFSEEDERRETEMDRIMDWMR